MHKIKLPLAYFTINSRTKLYVLGMNAQNVLLQMKKVSTYFQMLAEIIRDPPESDPFLCFLMFQVPFHVSLVAFSFQKFHSTPKKKNYPNPRTPLTT